MPSRKHQSLVKLLATSPRLLLELVHRWFGFQVPGRVELLRGPEVVRVLIHGHKRGSIDLVRTALKVARELIASDDEESRVLGDLIVGALGKGVRKIVEAEMIVDGEEWFSDVVGNYMKGRSEGKLEGRTTALGAVLDTRGLRPTEAQRARIERCRDPEQLETWLRRAVLAKNVAEILQSKHATGRARTGPSSARRRPNLR